jgi:hypothetical protein
LAATSSHATQDFLAPEDVSTDTQHRVSGRTFLGEGTAFLAEEPRVPTVTRLNLDSISRHESLHASPPPNRGNTIPVDLESEPDSDISTTAEDNINALPDSLLAPGTNADVIDKTAQLIASRGPEFEQHIISTNGERFAFLLAGHPARAFFELRLASHMSQAAGETAASLPGDTHVDQGEPVV